MGVFGIAEILRNLENPEARRRERQDRTVASISRRFAAGIHAGAQTAFIPLLTLGIPPNAVVALMVGARAGRKCFRSKPIADCRSLKFSGRF
jgi:TctA family transporter